MHKLTTSLASTLLFVGCSCIPPQAWHHEAEITQLVEAHIADSPIMGISVSIWHNGAWRMQRGWGHADQAQNIRATADTQFRTASISKSITGIIAFALEQNQKIDINRPINTASPIIDRHTYSLGDLLSNRSGTCHYDDNCGSLDNHDIHFSAKNSYQPVAEHIAAQPLSAEQGKPYYSTHAYSIAAHVIEGATQQSYHNVLDQYLNNPLNINIRCENLQQPNKNRSKLYELKNDVFIEARPDNIEWKCPGGGMEASTNELATLGKALRNNELLNSEQLYKMITPPDDQVMGTHYFAYGWATPTDNAQHWFGKRGDQLGGRAYLRVYTEEDLVIAVAGNTPGPSAPELTQSIADALLKDAK